VSSLMPLGLFAKRQALWLFLRARLRWDLEISLRAKISEGVGMETHHCVYDEDARAIEMRSSKTK
jgi:hypothetical protein